MATFLTVDDLQARVPRAIPHATFGRAGDRVWPHPVPQLGAALIAHWLVGSQGRLTCCWQTAESAPCGPPPD
jgi:hypothetical protein